MASKLVGWIEDELVADGFARVISVSSKNIHQLAGRPAFEFFDYASVLQCTGGRS